MTPASPLRSPALERWWPLTQSLDLVEGDVQTVAAAVTAEVTRFVAPVPLTQKWFHPSTLDEVFGQATFFTNTPTLFVVIPTTSRWSVIWNNAFGCDGHSSLCWNLTRAHRLTTLHWSAHDETTTFQPGAAFIHRVWAEPEMVERSVHVLCTDSKWSFHQEGQPIPEERPEQYTAKPKRHRLDEQRMVEFLARLDAHPWREDFYALERGCFVLDRPDPPAHFGRRPPSEVLQRGRKG